jgi:hypothetical protein
MSKPKNKKSGMNRFIETENNFEIFKPAPNFFKDIAVSIWQRDMQHHGIRFMKTIEYLKYMFRFSPVEIQIFGDNVIEQMTLLMGATRNLGYDKETNYALFNEVIADLESMRASKEEISSPEVALEYLVKNLVDTVNRIEKRAVVGKGPIREWPLIRIAAFVEMLYTKKYFKIREHRIKDCNRFSELRYGVTITNQLQKSKEKDRESNKPQLQKYFN